MKVARVWRDFRGNSIQEKDLLAFAMDLWKDGIIKIECGFDKVNNTECVRYSMKYLDEEAEEE